MEMYGSGAGYKLWFTRIIHLGKSREERTLKRSILTEIPHIEGRDFYPLLVEVDKRLRDAAAKQPRHLVAFHGYLM